MSDQSNLTFIKLGGSLITDKTQSKTIRLNALTEAAQEIASALFSTPGLQLVIGHGSGSFGHVAAATYGTAQGVRDALGWLGFTVVANVARELHTAVLETFRQEIDEFPILSLPVSASAQAEDGRITHMVVDPFRHALANGLIPITYGDVAFDSVRGGTILSTETVFAYLAEQLQPSRIFLLGETEGVYDADKAIIPHITPANFESVSSAITGSRGTDVTGGMLTKVRDMLALAGRVPGLQIRIFGSDPTSQDYTPGQIRSALRGESAPGTLITA